MADDDLELLKGDAKIVQEAKDRFKRCHDWEATAQTRFVNDMRFAHADPDNGWQWPNYLWSQRQDDPTGYKPRLTINKTRQHNLLIKNDIIENPVGIKVSPVGNQATFKAAQMWAGLIRRIERVSKAGSHYKQASSYCIDGGIGYLRVITDYVDDHSFNQEIYIRSVKNPLNVFLDPDASEPDKSDSNFGFVFEDMSKDEFLREHPRDKDAVGTVPLDNDSNWWVDDEHVRVVEYFRRSMKRDRLVLMRDPEDSKKKIIAQWSKIPAEIRSQIDPDTILQERELMSHTIEWFKIADNRVIEKGTFPGRYIPIVPVVADEVVIEGQLDRKGHTRNLKDAQRMYNFWTSSAVEQVALQTKSRWFIPVGASTNLETYYALINRQNYPFIPYNAMDEEGNPLPPPTPIEPPQMADGFIKGMMVAQNEFGMASGQREEKFGEAGNTISGKAINARVAQGDLATVHFKKALAQAVSQIGVIILAVAPYVYDTKQIKRILQEDGTEQIIELDPNAEAAYTEIPNEGDTPDDEAVRGIFNPTVGQYWVEADAGPAYSTQRQEAWNAFVQIVSQNQELVNVIGDVMFKNADFPGADEIAERLRRMVPPNILGVGPDKAMQEAIGQNQQLKQMIAELTEKLAKQELELKDKEKLRNIESYRAESDRLKQVGNAMSDLGEEQLRPIIEQTVREILSKQNSPEDEEEGHGEPDGDEAGMAGPGQGAAGAESASPAAGGPIGGQEPPVPGARLAPDGNYYVQNPEGGYSQVVGNG